MSRNNVVGPRAPNPMFWLSCFAAIDLLGLGFAAAYPTDLPEYPPNTPRVSTVAVTTLHPAYDTVQDAKPDAPSPGELYKFGLNAFLVPLLDDAAPARWISAAVEFACGPETTVMVDGEPMVAGQPIPIKAFTVRWMIDRCLPAGQESVELSGGVELVVHHKRPRLSALVKPDYLRIDNHTGLAWLQSPFTAETALDMLVAKPQTKAAPP